MFESVDRIAFYIGNYPVMKYGITMGIAILLSLVCLFKIRKIYYPEISEDILYDLSFWLIIGGIIGARLWYVLLNYSYYIDNLYEVLLINHGGISIHGALFGGIIAGVFFVKKKNLNFLQLADLYTLVLPIGQAVGRWGNFFNSEAYGKPCDLPWKLYIAPENRIAEYSNFEYFHPTFLYESILNICIFFILFFILRKKFESYSGIMFFCYLILYSVARIVVEFIRIDSVLDILNVPVAVIICIVTIILSILAIIKIYFVNNKIN